jgi:hypothetical protein
MLENEIVPRFISALISLNNKTSPRASSREILRSSLCTYIFILLRPDANFKNFDRISLSRAAKKRHIEFKDYNDRTPLGAAMNAHKTDINSKNFSTLLSGIRRADQIRYD